MSRMVLPAAASSTRRPAATGWGMAAAFFLLWMAALAFFLRMKRPPELPSWSPPAPMVWQPWEVEGDSTKDARVVWSPAAFSLDTPAGFTHSLRRQRLRLAPPLESARPSPAFLSAPAPLSAAAEPLRSAARRPPPGPWTQDKVFPPRPAMEERPRMEFSGGWEARLFSGIDRNFSAWTNAGWTAQIELEFDDKGVPVSLWLRQPSGRPEVDRRLVRSAAAWRLLEAAAPRRGAVWWIQPPPAGSSPPPEGGAP